MPAQGKGSRCIAPQRQSECSWIRMRHSRTRQPSTISCPSDRFRPISASPSAACENYHDPSLSFNTQSLQIRMGGGKGLGSLPQANSSPPG